MIYQVFGVLMNNNDKLIFENINNNTIGKNKRLLDVYIGMFFIIVIIKNEYNIIQKDRQFDKNHFTKYEELLNNINELIFDTKLIKEFLKRRTNLNELDIRLFNLVKMINQYNKFLTRAHIDEKKTYILNFISEAKQYEMTFGNYPLQNLTGRDEYLVNILKSYQTDIKPIKTLENVYNNKHYYNNIKNLIQNLLILLTQYPKYAPKKK